MPISQPGVFTILPVLMNSRSISLRAENVGAGIHYGALHLHPFYRNTYQLAADDFPAALDAYRRVISLPIYPGMNDEDVEDVIAAVEQIITMHRK